MVLLKQTYGNQGCLEHKRSDVATSEENLHLSSAKSSSEEHPANGIFQQFYLNNRSENRSHYASQFKPSCNSKCHTSGPSLDHQKLQVRMAIRKANLWALVRNDSNIINKPWREIFVEVKTAAASIQIVGKHDHPIHKWKSLIAQSIVDTAPEIPIKTKATNLS